MLREWKFNLQVPIDRASHVAIYLQIAHALIEEIRRGRLPDGSVLPGTRELAAANGWNRKTVIRAYEELVAQGWLVSRGARGTFVSSMLPERPRRAAPLQSSQPSHPSHPLRSEPPFEGPQFQRLRPGHSLAATCAPPGLLCLDDGVTDTRLFPVDAFARAYRGALSVAARSARPLCSDPRGSPVLREVVSTMLNVERGLATTADNICLTRGSQMALYLAARVLVAPGDVVVMEELSHPPAREAFRSAGADVVSVQLDENGLDVDHLEQICRRQRVRLVYVAPHHQFPTSVVLPLERRLRLLALSGQFGFAVVENDCDHAFHFVRKPLLPLASAEPAKVLYIGSLSKLLAPNPRIGYLVAPAAVVNRIAAEVLLLDRQGDQALEHAVAELVDAGDLRRHARKSLRIYAQRREVTASVLRDRLGGWADFRAPDGGLAFWLTFDDASRLDRLEAMAPAIGLRLPPSRGFSARPDGPRGLRFGFASLTPDELQVAVERLRCGVR